MNQNAAEGSQIREVQLKHTAASHLSHTSSHVKSTAAYIGRKTFLHRRPGALHVADMVQLQRFKVAVNTIVPRSPFFAFCTPKYRLLQTQNEMRSTVCVNEMALFGPFAAFFKGKTFFDSHGEKGGLPTRRDSGPTRYGYALH